MRRIIMFNRVSADGYYSGPDGSLDFAVPDDKLDKEAKLSDADSILFGRRTYELFESFWPHALDDSSTAQDPHSRRRRPEIRAMAVWINEATKLVFSKTRKEVTWKNSRLLHDFDPRQIEAMKSEPGKAIMVFGSGSIASLLTQHGLVDEYQFVVSPILLGSGKSLLTGVSKSPKLKLLEVKEYPTSNVMLRYARPN